jgi:predicted nucleic acid-binding protein
VAEIRYSLEQLPDGRRKDSLLATATEVFAAFSEFIQPFDADAAAWYATIVAGRDRLGLPMDGFDAQIAAICRTRGAALATRNAKDFRRPESTRSTHGTKATRRSPNGIDRLKAIAQVAACYAAVTGIWRWLLAACRTGRSVSWPP